MPHGKLTVVVEGATDIKTPGVFGRGGSYCTLACGSQVFRSPTVEGGGSHPCFKTAFEFAIDSTTNELNVCIYRKDSTSRDDDLVGYCTLIFKTIFFHGHTVPLTAFPIQQPSGNPSGRINISLKFKMRLSPNGHNTYAPMRCPTPPGVTPKIVSRQSISVNWGYDCPGEEASEAKSYRRTQSDPPKYHEDYLNLPETTSDRYRKTGAQSYHVNYHNFPGNASDNYQQTKPSFVRYGNPAKLRPRSPETPNHARPRPMIEDNQSIPSKPQYNQPVHCESRYNQPIPGKPQPPVFIQPQVQTQVQQRPNLLLQLGGQAVKGVADGFGKELANQIMGGVGQAVLGAFGN